MKSSRRSIPLALLIMALVGGIVPATAQTAVTPNACPAPSTGLQFTSSYIDTTRAGGEPIIATHPDGQLLWGSHAGTTHFFGPAAPTGSIAPFVQEYEGQTYYYVSEDDGANWTFVPRTPLTTMDPTSGLPNSGFSDPDFAIDTAGNVYVSEINLANIAVSKSSDGGRSYTLQNVFGLTFSDRQWMEADTENVLYMVANTFGGGSLGDTIPGVTGSLANRIYKSIDGGRTFSAGQATAGTSQASSDIKVDRATGAVYQLQTAGSELRMAVFPKARTETPPAMTIERSVIASGFSRGTTIGPTMDIDDAGNLYVTWDESGRGQRPAGIYYAASTDQGRTWSPAVRIDTGPQTDIWPWLAVGDEGSVAITWLQNRDDLGTTGTPSERAPASAGWDVMVAQTMTGLGCTGGGVAGFTVSKASAQPVHFGTVCNGGTLCQATATDRRLGDYFALEVDKAGNAIVAVSDTNMGGPVALPLAIRQTGGPRFIAAQSGGGGTGGTGTGGGGTGGDDGTGGGGTGGDDGTDPDSEAPASPGSGCDAASPSGDRVTRVTGQGGTGLGVAISRGCAASAPAAVLSRDDDYPDALAATALAAELGGPVLLTPTAGLSSDVASELGRLGVTEVVLAGGTAALSPQVEADLAAIGIAHRRIGGSERFSTAVMIADAVVAAGGPVDEVIIALGARPDSRDPWPDALTAGVLAGTRRAPVLLVTPDQVPGPTDTALAALLPEGATTTLAGGVEAIGQSVALELADRGYRVPRLAGNDRYGTSSALAGAALGDGAGLEVVILAGGDEFTAPLVGGAAAIAGGGVMLMIHPDDVDSGQTTREFLQSRAADIGRVIILGDEDLVSAEVMEQVRAILG
ncbi:hypothetical protein BH23ACT9_BH23ACT9_12240 [soil metagenome]